jgi:hypothetical protein
MVIFYSRTMQDKPTGGDDMKGAEVIAQRMVNAELAFVDYLQGLHGLTTAEAEKVLAVYRKLKVVKMDAAIGRLNVVHGAYFDKGAVRNAINFVL